MGIRQFFEILLGMSGQGVAAPATEMQRWQHALSGGTQARRQGDFAQADEIYNEILQEVRRAGNPIAEATVLGHIGALRTEEQRWEDAEQALDEAQVIADRQRNPVLTAAVMNDRGNYFAARGNQARAQEVLSQALVEARRGLDLRLTAHILGHLADLYLAEHNASYARRLLEEADELTDFQTPSYVGRLGEAAIATGQTSRGTAGWYRLCASPTRWATATRKSAGRRLWRAATARMASIRRLAAFISARPG